MKTFRLFLHPPGLQSFLGRCNRKKHSFRLSQLSRESPLSKDCGTQRKHLFRFWLHFPEAQRLSVRSIAKKQPRRLSLPLPESSPQQDFCNLKKRCVRSPSRHPESLPIGLRCAAEKRQVSRSPSRPQGWQCRRPAQYTWSIYCFR